MANSDLICITSKSVCTATISSASGKKSVNKSTREKSSSSRSHALLRLAVWKVSGEVCKWKEFQAMLKSLPHIQREKAQQLITNRPEITGLADAMKNTFFIQAPSNYIINFLSEKFDKRLQYINYRNSTVAVNSLRSAISAYHVHIDGRSVEKHPKVCALLTGIFNQRYPQPRYVFVLDVEIVLQYISTHDNSSLADAELTCKLTTLLALTTVSRMSMIQHLNTDFMAKDKDKYILIFCNKIHKSWRSRRFMK